MRAVWLGLLLLAVMIPGASAQVRPGPRPADGGSRETLESIYIPSLPDAPFTLSLATESVRPLGADGNTVTFHNRRTIARDRSGRIFEQRVYLVPPGQEKYSTPNWLQMADPAQHTLYNCSVATHVCHLLPYSPGPTTAPSLDDASESSAAGVVRRHGLGRDILDGVEVEGVRVTTVLNKGIVGNAQPITVEREFWYSPELGINLKSTTTDPRFGTQRFTVTRLSREEPDAALWQLPEGYSVLDERPAPRP